MESKRKLKLQCFICQSQLKLKSNQSIVKICDKFKIYTMKFFKSVSVEQISDSGDYKDSQNKNISCCVECVAEVETFCEMWEGLESLQEEMIQVVVTISNLTKFLSHSANIIAQERSTKDCFICQALPSSTSNLEIETCLKFITLVERFVLNTEKFRLDKKILQIFVEMAKVRNFVSLYCCDICLTELVTFCEMYEALESLRLEILQILDRISNRSKYLQSSVENCRKRSFPRVKLERLPNLGQVEHEETSVNRELMEVTDSVSKLKAHTQNEHQLDEDDLNIEMASSGMPSPASSLNDDEHADKSEAEPTQRMNILQSSHFTMKSVKMKSGRGRKPKPFKACACLFCEKKFPTRSRLEIHMRSHTGERSFVCSICLQEFSNKYILEIHRRRRHFGEEIPKICVCDICGKSFRTKNGLKVHVRGVHEKLRPCKCDICGKAFFSNHQINKHKRAIHDGIKGNKDVCHICGKIVSTKYSLALHLKLLHPSESDESLKLEKKFKCSIADCNWAFYNRNKLQRHILTHTGEKNFQCDQCGKSFQMPFQLRRHKECHKEVRPHICAHCGWGFNYKHRLTEHEKKYHSGGNNVNIDM